MTTITTTCGFDWHLPCCVCRAEATDVANAVLDGVDCIMLGAETLRGKHPVATVETILHICKQAEKVFDHDYHFETLMRVSKPCPPFALLLNGLPAAAFYV